MNKKGLILAASALAMVLSCNVREESLPLPRRVTFQAVQGDNPSTRTALQSDGSVFWTPGDAINLFYGEAISAKMVFDSTATGAVAQASFTGMLPEGFYPDGKDEFWAVYPYDKDNVFDGSSVTFTLPDLQPALAGTFADDLFISLARSTGYELSFYNLCGGIKFSVNTPGITRVSFFGHQEEVLAGKVKVGFDEHGKPLVQEIVEGSQSIQLDAPSGGFEVGKWYYMVALPTTLAMGYTMSFFQDGDLVSERSVETPVAIKRSIWGRITGADVVDSGSQPNNEIWYTSTDGSVVTPKDGTSFGEGISIVSNTYENGLGIIKFDGVVTQIGSDAFYLGWNIPCRLMSIEIPEGCLEIGQGAFQYCTNLEDVKLPETLTVIDRNAFYSCSSLRELVLPESLTEIGFYAFCSCSSLREMTIPESVVVLSDGAFSSCTGLERFKGKYADESGRALIDGTRLVAVAPSGLTTYSVSNGITVIGGGAFEGYANLTEIILPDGLLILNGASFADCDGLTELIIPETVYFLGGEDFRYCDNLVRVNIPSGITTIPGECFLMCKSLLEVTIPSKVTRIDSYAFRSCSGLEKVFVEAVTPPTGGNQMFNDTNDCPIYVPAESVDAYKAAEYWSEYADRIQAMPGDISASQYLTFSSRGTTTVSLTNIGDNAPVLYYSTDAQTWTKWDYSELTFTADAPLYLCGDNPEKFNSFGSYSTFTAAGDTFGVSGDIMSLVNKDQDVLTIPDYQYFYHLFINCDLLTSAPSLSATSLTSHCYESMFEGCTGLTSAPELPAETAAWYCYASMFKGCTGLTTAPALPATTLDTGSYKEMFYNCSSLQEAPTLPASTLTSQCYEYMFYGCSSLLNAPELAATALAEKCYDYMFCGCSSMETAPELPATALEKMCYFGMFIDCSSLTAAPALPSTSLAYACYERMFAGCTGLTTAPELPATTLAEGCYYSMFQGCSNLVSAPDLPAQTLVKSCYNTMFAACTSLNYVKCLATDISAEDCTSSWMMGVSSQGTFVKTADVQWLEGTSGIPEGWTVMNDGDVPGGGNEGTGDEDMD